MYVLLKYDAGSIPNITGDVIVKKDFWNAVKEEFLNMEDPEFEFEIRDISFYGTINDFIENISVKNIPYEDVKIFNKHYGNGKMKPDENYGFMSSNGCNFFKELIDMTKEDTPEWHAIKELANDSSGLGFDL